MNYLTFGLPLGSALVLMATINSLFVIHSVENFAEVILSHGFYPAHGDGLTTVSVIVPLLLVLYVWFFVIIKGSRGHPGHISFWIGVYLLTFLISLAISVKSLSVTPKGFRFWRKLWSIIVSIVFDSYVISVGIRCVNFIWRKTAPSSPSLQRESELNPIGYSFTEILKFYHFNPAITVRLLLMVDIIWSSLALLITTIPSVILAKYLGSGYYGSQKGDAKLGVPIFNLIENFYLRLARVILSLVAFQMITNHKQPGLLRRVAIAHLFMSAMSAVIWFHLWYHLFTIFEEMSASEQFQRANSLLDLMFRLLIVHVFIKHIEKTEQECS